METHFLEELKWPENAHVYVLLVQGESSGVVLPKINVLEDTETNPADTDIWTEANVPADSSVSGDRHGSEKHIFQQTQMAHRQQKQLSPIDAMEVFEQICGCQGSSLTINKIYFEYGR